MNLADRRDTYNGFGDALARAFELVTTPAIFGWFGWLLDGRLGTRPLFTLVFTLLVFGYVAWKMWSGYETTMQAQERKLLGRDERSDAGSTAERRV